MTRPLNAIIERENGVLLEIEVRPNAKKRAIGFNRWRSSFEVKIDQRAEHGRANEAIIRFLADIFSLKPSNITIIRGLKSRHKTIELKGITKEEVIESLKRIGVSGEI